jgi:hypothetical protein
MRPIGPGSPIRRDGAPRSILAGGASEIRQMAFARVDDEKTGFARCSQDIAAGFHRARQLRDIVAERFAEAAGLQEIALHVDDHQRGFRPDEFDWHRFGCEQIFGRGHSRRLR